MRSPIGIGPIGRPGRRHWVAAGLGGLGASGFAVPAQQGFDSGDMPGDGPRGLPDVNHGLWFFLIRSMPLV